MVERMSEQISCESLTKNDFFSQLIVQAIVNLPNDVSFPWPKTTADGYEMILTVNGCELPIRETLSAIEKQIDKMVLEKAQKLLDEKFHGIYNLVDDSQQLVRDMFDELKRKCEP